MEPAHPMIRDGDTLSIWERTMVSNRNGRTKNYHLQGFTLIELLIVVAIIGILAAIAVPNFLSAQVRAKVSRAQSDMRSLGTALEAYRVDHNTYPPDGDDLPSGGPLDFDARARMRLLTTPIAYIATLPVDPFHTEPVEFPGSDLLFQGPAPHTYAYNTFGAYQANPSTFMPANNGKPDNFGLTSIGPNKNYDAIAGAPIEYNSSNGVISAGDIYYFGGNRTPLSP